MKISMWFMVLALAGGLVASQTSEGDSTTDFTTRPPTRIESNCWINGVWYNPCPEDYPNPAPTPRIQPLN